MKYMKSIAVAALFAAGLSACQQAGREQVVESRAIESIMFSSHGKQYQIRYKWDNLLAGYGAEINRVGGASFTGDLSEDVEVQNTLRDAFNAKVCNEGLYAGLVNLGYGYMDKGRWGANLKCTSKHQQNI